jgi:hypothetical protein
VFSEMVYVWRANTALTQLGFPIATLSGDFRVKLWSASRRMELTPKEAACVFLLDELGSWTAIAQRVMQHWIVNGDIRPGMLEAARSGKREAALALEQAQSIPLGPR